MAPRALMRLTRPRALAACLVGVVGLLPAASRAGLSVDQMLERHRELVAIDQGSPLPTTAPRRGRVAVQLGRAPFARVPFEGDPARPFTSAPLVGPDLPLDAGVAVEQTLLAPEENRLAATVRLGAEYSERDDRWHFVGSEIALPLGPGTAYVSNESRHWGPGWFGSTILDAAAPPVAAGGWRFGEAADAHWRGDFFAGRLRGAQTYEHPWLIGMRLEWRPTPAWTLALSRTMQVGGRGRDESLRTLLRALVSSDTVGRAGVTTDNEPGNEEGAFDARYAHRWRDADLGVYLQLTAEDKGKYVPTRRMPLVGADAGVRLGALSLRAIAEFVQTQAGSAHGLAYTHHIYQGGYTNRNEPLGHPIGGDSRLASLGLLLDDGRFSGLLALHHGRALPESQRFVAGDTLEGGDAALRIALRRDLRVGLSLHAWRAGAETRHWGQVFAEYTWDR